MVVGLIDLMIKLSISSCEAIRFRILIENNRFQKLSETPILCFVDDLSKKVSPFSSFRFFRVFRYNSPNFSMFAFSAVNLGCSKNLVDLEFAIGEILKWSDRVPVEYISDPDDPNAEYVIVNTCGFLSSARRESEETLAYYDSL